MPPAEPRLRLIFMGTPEFALPALRALGEAGHAVVCAYAQPPRPAGRGHKPVPAPVAGAAAAAGIPVRTPASLKDPDEQAAFAALDADAAVVAAYGLILPKPVLAAPRLGCLNIHASLLPRWRGAAPIQRAILAGDGETGVTIMQMDEGLDTGPILLARPVPITAETTAADLHDRLAALGAELVLEALAGLAAGTLAPRPQPTDGVTYAPKLSRAEGRLDWTRPAAALERQVRALVPWPGAWFEAAGERIKIHAAGVVAGAAAAPGTLLDGRFTVACGHGALRLLRVQRPGRAAMDGGACLRGLALRPGAVLAPAAPAAAS